MKPLLLILMTLNNSYLNPEINADLDDFLVENNCGQRLSRRIKRGYYNAFSKGCLNDTNVDPLKVFGADARNIIFNAKKVPFDAIGEIKIGNKIYRINTDNSIITDASLI